MYTKENVIRQLQAMNAPQDSVVLMHTSLRAIGNVEGGAEGLLEILISYFTEKGGLFCVPTHTWHNIKREITLDMASDDTCLGSFAKVALRYPGGVRTENPTHSMVVFGNAEKTREFIKDEPFIKSPTAPDSCYGKLYTWGGYVLLAGVAQNRNTYLHAVEEILNIPNRMDGDPVSTCTRRENGERVRRVLAFYQADFTHDVSERFPKYDTAFRYHRCITDGFVGNAPAQLCDAIKMKETMELIFRNSEGKDPLQNEIPIPQKWYCTK